MARPATYGNFYTESGLIYDNTTSPGGIALGSAIGPGTPLRSIQDNPPTVGSGGAGVSVLSVQAGSTNLTGAVLATLTAVAPGVVVGVVTFDDNPLPTAPRVVAVWLEAPTAGVAAPPVVASDTYTTNGFTIRVTGPTTVTTAAYVIGYLCVFA